MTTKYKELEKKYLICIEEKEIPRPCENLKFIFFLKLSLIIL